jgi:cytochrome bd-type quinol oxidase subunit 2
MLLIEIWFALLCFMLIVFVVLDGWDIGAGILHHVVARTDRERREVIAAIGPLWSWHEVWLVAAGGTFVLAFPARWPPRSPGSISRCGCALVVRAEGNLDRSRRAHP